MRDSVGLQLLPIAPLLVRGAACHVLHSPESRLFVERWSTPLGQPGEPTHSPSNEQGFH